jgi:hypothetical protein
LTFGMDALLALLLIAALVTGVRLHGRLNALRAGQEGFVKAVVELNAAADKADGALRALRAASEDAHDALLARIETARGLTLKLEKASEVAQKAATRAEEAAAMGEAAPQGPAALSAFAAPRSSPPGAAFKPGPAPLSGLGRSAPSRGPVSAHPPEFESRGAPGSEGRRALDALLAARGGRAPGRERAQSRDPEPTTAEDEDRPLPILELRAPRPPAPRRRPLADEDLFDDQPDAGPAALPLRGRVR